MGVGPQPHAPAASIAGKDPVPIVQEAGWAPEPVWAGAENLVPTGIRSLDRPARSQSLYRLPYPAHLSYSNCVKMRVLLYRNINGRLFRHCVSIYTTYICRRQWEIIFKIFYSVFSDLAWNVELFTIRALRFPHLLHQQRCMFWKEVNVCVLKGGHCLGLRSLRLVSRYAVKWAVCSFTATLCHEFANLVTKRK